MHQSLHVCLLAEYTYFYKNYHVFYVNKGNSTAKL